MQTILNDEPVNAVFSHDVQHGGGNIAACVVICSRCGASTEVVGGCDPTTRLFGERCSYCEAKLKYPDGANW